MKWAYTGDVEVDDETVEDVTRIFRHFECFKEMEACAKFLCKTLVKHVL